MYFSDIDQIVVNFMKTVMMGSNAKDLKGIVAEFREFRKWVEDNCSLKKMLEEEFVKIGSGRSVVVDKKEISKSVVIVDDKKRLGVVIKKRGRPKKVLDI